jgi:uncharacterized protein YggE
MRLLLTSALVAVFAGAAMAAEPTETITVTASATVFVKPDSARIHYLLRVSEPSIEEAKDSASKLVTSLDENLKKLKLPDLTTTAGAITYGRATTSARAARAGFPAAGAVNPGGKGAGPAAARETYSAQVPLTATIRDKDPDKLRSAVDAFVKKIVESGAIISGDVVDSDSPFASALAAARASAADAARIEWLLSDDSAARRDALRAAIRKAKADAETLSKELGWDKLTVLSVADGLSTSTVLTTRELLDLSTATPKTPAGEVPVSVRVTLKCSR